MKRKNIVFFVILLITVSIFSGCLIAVIPPDISVEYYITNVTISPGFYMNVEYIVENRGDTDLEDIQLKFGVETGIDDDYDDYSAWSSKFDLDKGDDTFRSITIYGSNIDSGSEVMIVRINMDNPEDPVTY